MRTPLSRKKRAAFVSLIALVTYALAELVSYCALPRSQPVRGATVSMSSMPTTKHHAGFGLGIVHPYVGYCVESDWRPNDPEFKFPFTWDEEFTNQPFDGFPSLEPVVQKRDPKKAVIAIFGGSVAEIFYRQGAQFLPQYLRQLPQYRDKKIVLVCASYGGYKQPQQLMALNYILAQAGQIDVAINLDGFNEVALPRSAWEGASPLFPWAWNQRVGKEVVGPELKFYGRAVVVDEKIDWWQDFFSTFPMRLSPTCQLFWSVKRRWLEQELAANVVEARRITSPAVSHGIEFTGTDDQFYDELARIWEDSSRQMRKLCEANGIPYFHFLQPNQDVPDSKEFSKQEKNLALASPALYETSVRSGYPRLRAAGERLKREGEKFADLTNAFRDVRGPIYGDSCCHFGSQGNEIISRLIGEAIMQANKTHDR